MTIRLRSNGHQLGFACPDCSGFIELVVDLQTGGPHLVSKINKDTYGYETHEYVAWLQVDSEQMTQQFVAHILRDPAAHPSFATPTPDSSLG